MQMSMGEFMGLMDTMSSGGSTTTRLRIGDTVELEGLEKSELNGRMVRLIRLGDDGRAECNVRGRRIVRVKVCNLKYPLTGVEVTDKMHRVFPELKEGFAPGTRVERKIKVHGTGVELPCVPGTVLDDQRPVTSHQLGVTVDSTVKNLTVTLWTVDQKSVVASRVANVGLVDGHLFVGATFINMFGHEWVNDCALWVDQWLSERLGETLDEESSDSDGLFLLL